MNRSIAAALLAAIPISAQAHHGKDFLVVESYDVPHPGDIYGIGTSEWEKEDGETATALEPALLAGITHRVAGEVHAHFVREPGGHSFEYEAIAPELRVQITDPADDLPVNFGASFEYEFGANGAPDALQGRLILEHSFDRLKLSLNGIIDRVESGDAEYGYAAGARVELSEQLALGLESQGSFDSGANESLAGIYWEPVERLTLKLGAGGRLGSNGPDATLRAGIVCRF